MYVCVCVCVCVCMCLHVCVAYVFVHMTCTCCVYVTQGWEDVTQLKDEMVTQQKKIDQLKTELTDLDKAENSLKVWATRGQVFSAMAS